MKKRGGRAAPVQETPWKNEFLGVREQHEAMGDRLARQELRASAACLSRLMEGGLGRIVKTELPALLREIENDMGNPENNIKVVKMGEKINGLYQGAKRAAAGTPDEAPVENAFGTFRHHSQNQLTTLGLWAGMYPKRQEASASLIRAISNTRDFLRIFCETRQTDAPERLALVFSHGDTPDWLEKLKAP